MPAGSPVDRMQSISGRWSDALRNDRLILEAAARVLAEDPKATMQRIADEAGVARLTVYRRYRDREALRRAIFEAAAAEAHRNCCPRPSPAPCGSR
jgi:AcrR family transcriptional regulator